MPLTPETWLSDFVANLTTLDFQHEPRITQLTNGNIIVAWTSFNNTGVGSTSGSDIIGQLFDPLGNRIGAEIRLNQGFFADNERACDIAALDNGRFVVVFEDENGLLVDQAIVASVWSTTATGIGPNTSNVQIAGSPDAGDYVLRPTVTGAADGSFTVGYEHYDSSTSTSGTRFVNVSAGGIVGAATVAISGSSSSSTVSARLTNGNVVFVQDYTSAGDSGIVFSVRNPGTGAAVVGATYVTGTNGNGDADTAPAVVALTGGGFVIAWSNTDTNDTDIEFQQYTNAGAATGAIITVAGGAATDNNNEVALVAMADGGFLVLWDDDEAGQGAGRGQRYSSSGLAVGSEFVYDGSNANATEAVLLGDGRVAIVWSGTEIHMAIVDTRDAANAGVYSPDQFQIGTVGDDVIIADGTSEYVYGHDGNDTITETGQIREYYGGAGNDRINVVSAINSDVHDGGIGIDTIDWSGTTVFGATFDMQLGTASTGLSSERMVGFENLIGTLVTDIVYGNGEANSINGRLGDDTIYGEAGADRLYGAGGNDSLYGGDGVDLLVGGAGNDVLNGGLSDDVMWGNTGDDSYVATSSLDRAIELAGGGTDTVYAATNYVLGANIERLVMTASFNTNGTGNAEINVIAGNAGHNILSGGAGDDTIYGGAGNDKMFGDAGNDWMVGGSGDDSFFVNSATDVAFEAAGQGNDRVVSSVSFTLGANVETLRMIGSGNLIGSGNAGNNTIIANTGDDWLIGANGNDVLLGTAGGDNKYLGGAGIDWSYGGAGHDVFHFIDGWDADRIYNFQVGPGGDDISLIYATNITSFADLVTNHLTNDAFGNALIHDGSDVIRVMGVAAAALTIDNFIF